MIVLSARNAPLDFLWFFFQEFHFSGTPWWWLRAGGWSSEQYRVYLLRNHCGAVKYNITLYTPKFSVCLAVRRWHQLLKVDILFQVKAELTRRTMEYGLVDIVLFSSYTFCIILLSTAIPCCPIVHGIFAANHVFCGKITRALHHGSRISMHRSLSCALCWTRSSHVIFQSSSLIFIIVESRKVLYIKWYTWLILSMTILRRHHVCM